MSCRCLCCSARPRWCSVCVFWRPCASRCSAPNQTPPSPIVAGVTESTIAPCWRAIPPCSDRGRVNPDSLEPSSRAPTEPHFTLGLPVGQSLHPNRWPSTWKLTVIRRFLRMSRPLLTSSSLATSNAVLPIPRFTDFSMHWRTSSVLADWRCGDRCSQHPC